MPYYEQLCADTFGNLDEIEISLEKHKWLKSLKKKYITRMSFIKEIEFVVKTFPQTQS